MEWDRFEAVLFDLDGVVTPTAEVHMRAWSLMFNDFLETREGQAAYTDADYFAYVDGKPRYEGVASFLGSRGLDVPYGDPGDPPDAETVCGLGNRKNDAFGRVLRDDGVTAYPGSVALLDALARRGVPMAIVSSSRNAPDVLAAAGVTHYFATVMHGGVAEERGLPGKPAPDTFVAAAADLGVAPARAVVLEDAISGVRAGAAGGFALVVGVDRGVGEVALREAGAALVVTDLGELL
ncbi:MAG: beta-phosphoglucomutase family hydrolase [Nocardioides sp.]